MFKSNVALEVLPCCTNPVARIRDVSVRIARGHVRNATAALFAV